MPFITSFDAADFLSTAISLLVAFGLGALIGLERQYRQRTAGLRTNVLVAIGACQFVDMAMHLAGAEGAVRVIAYVVSGIGFLGAGVIMKEGANVRGLNTAATLWCSAAVGACAGADLVAQAVLLTAFVLAGNTMLRPLVQWLERMPRHAEFGEASYEVVLMVKAELAAELQDRMAKLLDAAKYPASTIDAEERGESLAELTATLVATSVRPEDLNAAVAQLRQLPGVTSAGWSTKMAD